MTFVYIARGENHGEPESYTLGAYATRKEAEDRINKMDEDEGLEYMWVDKVRLGKACFLSNR